ncbi:MAG: DUF86 domain-containing protein [Deltaproteobacteria bacterium]|nr:DUF86 domain-containing protein [Nannocystaceae bacterium]
MTDGHLLLHKLGELRSHLVRARRRRGDDFADFAADEDRRDALMLSVMIALQEAVDCAFHVAVDSDLGIPTSNSNAFTRLAGAGLISSELATTLGEGARLRNRIAHGYASVDLERFWLELPQGLDALDAFAAAMTRVVSIASEDAE